MYKPIDKRKVYFQNLSPETTTKSLEAYLSKHYEIQLCDVPSESGKLN
jgi:hypothetical protein